MQIPNDWRDALVALQANFPEAVIAGGAIRDLLTKKPVKDIDVFISGVKDQDTVKDILAATFGRPVKTIIGEALAGYSEALTEIMFTLETTTSAGTPIQIIAMNGDVTLERMVERIDFGICKVGTDGTKDLIHPDFVYDLEHRQFTLRCNYNEPRLTRSKIRYERLKEKFLGWPMVIPTDRELDDMDVGISWSA